MKTLLLNEQQVKSLLTMKEAVDICDKTFADLALGNTLNPAKVNLNLGDSEPTKLPYKASLNAMPAYIGWQDVAGMKWAGGFGKGRIEIGRPFLNALILLIQPNYGDFQAVMDGSWIMAMRTGAQSAVCLRHLWSGKKSGTFGIFGCGLQGRTQTMALASEYHIDKLIVYDPIPAATERFVKDMQDVVQGEIVVAKEPKEVAESDACISVTNANDQFIKGEWFGKGSVYLSLGSYSECDDQAILGADHIIVDHVQQCLHRGNLKRLADQGKLDENSFYCTVGEMAAGLRSVENVSQKNILMVPIGMGCLDVACAGIVYKKAISMGLGETFMFDQK